MTKYPVNKRVRNFQTILHCHHYMNEISSMGLTMKDDTTQNYIELQKIISSRVLNYFFIMRKFSEIIIP